MADGSSFSPIIPCLSTERKIVWKAYETAKARYHSQFEKLDDGDTYLRAQVDRIMEEDRAILAAPASTEKKSENEAEDD